MSSSTLEASNGLYAYSPAIGDLSWSFVIAMSLLFLLAPLYRSKKSFFDHIAARHVLAVLRCFLVAELILNCLLLYMYTYKGEPIVLHAVTDYGNGTSWIYGAGRPVCGMILVTFGIVGDMHPMARYVCLFGSMLQVATDAISAIQIRDLLSQIYHFHVAQTNYSSSWLNAYYWRDLVSFGICIYIFCLCAHFSSLAGWCSPLISYRVISGGDMDRCQVMRESREYRLRSLLEHVPWEKKKRKAFHNLAEAVDKEEINLEDDLKA